MNIIKVVKETSSAFFVLKVLINWGRNAAVVKIAARYPNMSTFINGLKIIFLLNDQNQVIYKFFSSDVLGYSSNMRDPLKFLSDLIKE